MQIATKAKTTDMRKSDKKLENQIRTALTEVCDEILDLNIGFQWLTHLVDFDRVNQSLTVICVFDTDENMQAFATSTNESHIKLTIQARLKALGIKLAQPDKQIRNDSEEACLRSHGGKWSARFISH